MTEKETDQVKFWRGEFGDEYVNRNAVNRDHMKGRLALWVKISEYLQGDPPKSILEVGPNIGLNLRALNLLTPAELYAVEPNEKAREILLEDKVLPKENLINGFAGDYKLPCDSVELAFTSGVLIHIHPDDLLAACRNIHASSSKYIVCYEYFSDKPEVIPYRGHDDKLFKRDFGAFWLDNFPDLKLLGYGFEWKVATGMDNATWWVFEKK